MSAPSLRLSVPLLALAAALALAAPREDADPEPPGNPRGETVSPAVDLEKAKKDRNLARLVAQNEAVSSKNILQLALSFHAHADARNGVLPDDITDRNGKPLLSWRVAVLPHIGQQKLYEQFKLDQAWDSPHNRKLLLKMPDLFRSPRVKARGKGNTVYQVFTGKNALFGRGRPARLPADFPDGTSNTIVIVESSTAMPWTKPGGIPFDHDKELPDFGKAYGKRPLAALGDGSVRILDLNKVSAATLKKAIDPADGFPLGADW